MLFNTCCHILHQFQKQLAKPMVVVNCSGFLKRRSAWKVSLSELSSQRFMRWYQNLVSGKFNIVNACFIGQPHSRRSIQTSRYWRLHSRCGTIHVRKAFRCECWRFARRALPRTQGISAFERLHPRNGTTAHSQTSCLTARASRRRVHGA